MIKKRRAMTFDAELTEDVPPEITEAMNCIFGALKEAIDNPTDIIEIHVFTHDTKDTVQDILNELSVSYPEADNIDVVLDTIH